MGLCVLEELQNFFIAKSNRKKAAGVEKEIEKILWIMQGRKIPC